MAQLRLTLGQFLIAVAVLVSCPTAFSRDREDTYQECLELLSVGDYWQVIEVAGGAPERALQRPRSAVDDAVAHATALEIVAGYEVETERRAVAIRHLTEALAALSAVYTETHPRVAKIAWQLKSLQQEERAGAGSR